MPLHAIAVAFFQASPRTTCVPCGVWCAGAIYAFLANAQLMWDGAGEEEGKSKGRSCSAVS